MFEEIRLDVAEDFKKITNTLISNDILSITGKLDTCIIKSVMVMLKRLVVLNVYPSKIDLYRAYTSEYYKDLHDTCTEDIQLIMWFERFCKQEQIFICTSLCASLDLWELIVHVLNSYSDPNTTFEFDVESSISNFETKFFDNVIFKDLYKLAIKLLNENIRRNIPTFDEFETRSELMNLKKNMPDNLRKPKYYLKHKYMHDKDPNTIIHHKINSIIDEMFA